MVHGSITRWGCYLQLCPTKGLSSGGGVMAQESLHTTEDLDSFLRDLCWPQKWYEHGNSNGAKYRKNQSALDKAK